MLIVHVAVVVKQESIEAFKSATEKNASLSLMEDGVARFDVVQELDEPTNFLLIEVYKTEQAPAAHKLTPHYLEWRDAVAPMMAVPRSSIKYAAVFPAPTRWQALASE